MRGLPNNRRIHAKNFIQAEAEQRLTEVVKPYQQQGLNALGVDSYEVLLFIKKPSTQSCTCREIQTDSELGSAKEIITHTGITQPGVREIVIDWRRPLFGESGEARTEEDDGTEFDDYEFDDAPSPHANQVIESSADCGICYRSGFLPGFEQYGQSRIVLSTHDIVDQHSYTINRSVGPHIFERLHQNGWIEFEIRVPKYFKTVKYSIRNNQEILDSSLFTQLGACDLAFLDSNRGKKIRLRINAQKFTHVVLTFDVGSSPIYANIAQMSKATDWTLFNTIGNLNVILPMTIPEMVAGSYIIVPKTGITLVVTDITYMRVATQSNLDWSVNTRVSQPQEAQGKIHKGFSIF